jgi:small subunit ribosomal protein S1
MSEEQHVTELARTAVAAATLSAPTAPTVDDEAYWSEHADYSTAHRKQLENLYSNTLQEFNEQEIVRGTVISVDDREVIVNIGFKSEGIIPRSEFRDKEVSIGDDVEVFINKVENTTGQLDISFRTAQSVRAWEIINEALESDTVLEGTVKRRTKGGFVVDLVGIEAFLPGSQIDVKPIRDYDMYVNRRMEFKVVKINKLQHNVVISHKALIEKDLEAQKAEIINNLERGQVLEGTVKNITSFGVFIDLGGVDGLLHITDISWGRINSPEEVLNLDMKINVVVLDFDDDKRRISLGYKQLQPHPWDNLPETIEVGAVVNGKVVTIAEYGIFVEVMPGVEGLIHVSEMSWSQQPKNPSELYSLSQEVEAVILTLDREERKMSLGIKQLSQDPWNVVPEKYTVGTQVKVTVRNITNYGLFVELEEGIDGLIHVQDLSWSRKINHPSEFTERDAKLDAVVLELDIENRRLRLGHKQLTEDPWETLEDVFPVGSEHEATLTRIVDKGATVELSYGIEGFVPGKQLRKEDDSELKEGEVAKFVVIEFNKELKKIVLSHSQTWKPEENLEKPAKVAKTGGAKKTSEPAMKAAAGSGDKDTLGDLSVLAQLKADMVGEAAATIKSAAAPLATAVEAPAAEVAEAPVAEVVEAPVEEAAAEVAEAPEAEAADEAPQA